MATIQETNHSDIIALLPAYAINSLDAGETEIVTRHLPNCPECRAELAHFAVVVDALPYAAPEAIPAPDLKARLFEQIQTASAKETAVTTKPLSWWQRITAGASGLFNPGRWQLATVLAVLLLLVGSFALWQLLKPAAPDQFILTPTAAAPHAQGVMEVGSNSQKATLTVTGLPPLSAENQYQLWLIQDGVRVSGGVFSVEADGSQTISIHAPQPIPDYGAFGITIEPAGGSPGPTGERVLGYNL